MSPRLMGRMKRLERITIAVLSVILSVIILLRLFGSDFMATVFFVLIIYSALIFAIVNSAEARRKHEHH